MYFELEEVIRTQIYNNAPNNITGYADQVLGQDYSITLLLFLFWRED